MVPKTPARAGGPDADGAAAAKVAGRAVTHPIPIRRAGARRLRLPGRNRHRRPPQPPRRGPHVQAMPTVAGRIHSVAKAVGAVRWLAVRRRDAAAAGSVGAAPDDSRGISRLASWVRSPFRHRTMVPVPTFITMGHTTTTIGSAAAVALNGAAMTALGGLPSALPSLLLTPRRTNGGARLFSWPSIGPAMRPIRSPRRRRTTV